MFVCVILLRKFRGIVLPGWLLLCAVSIQAEQAPIRVVTEHLPPFQFLDEDRRVAGLATEIVRELLRISNTEATIEVLPWSEAYQIASTEPNVMIYSIVRSEEREDSFQWVGAIIEHYQYYFYSLNEKPHTNVRTLRDAKDKTLAVVKDSYEHQLAIQFGFGDRIKPFDNRMEAVRQLYAGAVDLTFGSHYTVFDSARRLEKNIGSLQYSSEMGVAPAKLSVAFSLGTDAERVDRFREALAALKRRGYLRHVSNKWLTQLRSDEVTELPPSQ